jgi:ADP-heptose:LPS heptosyltransferase
MVFYNRKLKRTFGPEMEEVRKTWRKIRNEEFCNLYSLPRMIKSKRMRWVGHIARMEDKRNAYEVLVETPVGKRPLGGPRHRWEDDIKWILKK